MFLTGWEERMKHSPCITCPHLFGYVVWRSSFFFMLIISCREKNTFLALCQLNDIKKTLKQTSLSHSIYSMMNEDLLCFKNWPDHWGCKVQEDSAFTVVSIWWEGVVSKFIMIDNMANAELEESIGCYGHRKRVANSDRWWGWEWVCVDEEGDGPGLSLAWYLGITGEWRQKWWGAVGMFQTYGASYAKTALENNSLGEEGPVMMEEKGQVPDDKEQLCLIIWTVCLHGSPKKNLLWCI